LNVIFARVAIGFKVIQTKDRPEEPNDAKSERFSDRAVNNKVDRGVEDQEEIVERYEDDEGGRIRKSVLFGAEDVVIFQALVRMNSLKKMNQILTFCCVLMKNYSALYCM
jgi:hypothetical protein